MGIGQAGVFAGHAAIIVSALMIFWRFVPMARAVEHGPFTVETRDALRLLPLTVALIAVVAMIEAIYYGAARILINHGVDLWKSYEAVWVLRASVAITLILHMPAYWRFRGYDRAGARRRTYLDAGIIALIWVGALWGFS